MYILTLLSMCANGCILYTECTWYWIWYSNMETGCWEKTCIYDPLNKNPAHPAFYENRDKTGNLVQQWRTGSDRLLGSRVTERNTSWTWNASLRENAMFLRYYGKLWRLCILSYYAKSTRVLLGRQLKSRQRQLEKRAVVKAGAYIVSIDKKETVYKLEACEIAFFANHALAVHSCVPAFHLPACEFKLIASL